MNDNALHIVEAAIREQAAAYCASNGVPGLVAGVHHAGAQIIVAHGVANTATGAPMRADTGFLFGSVTKVLTTMLVLQQVERELLDLDAPVTRYLPRFALAAPGAADKILVRTAPPQRCVPIRPGLFAPAGYPLETFDGYLRLLLVSYHDIRDGRARFRNAGGRLSLRN
ncbi:serine hydrolase domain-containing protein [Nocardia implantans]|uniref:Serine hydrolase domain-containing protein n=1 Tax=Nocardia implantans TaxID=3108168 RepID=A0ABU6AVL3_9NOCA|nr:MULTISPECIES: serine hydrolase domain-containing protein [unclassified Nocardia]MBF6192592.1 beta-lactamase family protein [Nocardia beijingensis]MEA3527501.1 serine hydrolase domain-containing protein [Nocardia sp. CDC192]MEB3511209.1 serine hydrolase domain-containing protein [Nocardia sp. CDC186]